MMKAKLNSHVRTSEEGYFVYPGVLRGDVSSECCFEVYSCSPGEFLSSGRGGAAC